MRVQRFDGHSKEVRTAGRRASHVDQRKTAAEKYAGKKRSEHRIAVIGRRERKDEIQKKGIDQNRADGFDHKFTPDNPVTEQNQGNVDDEGGCTDRQVPQVVQNQGDAGDTARREVCELCKGIDADCGKDAAEDVAE